MEWNTNLKNQNELEKQLMAKEVMNLRRDCKKLYDALKSARNEIWDLYGTPKKQLEDRLEDANKRADGFGVITDEIERKGNF